MRSEVYSEERVNMWGEREERAGSEKRERGGGGGRGREGRERGLVQLTLDATHTSLEGYCTAFTRRSARVWRVCVCV